MKKYIANDELINILKKNNFFEQSTPPDKKTGIKRFNPSRALLKEIVFENNDIAVYDAGILQESKAIITEDELRILILFFKLKRIDIEEITINLPFTFATALERYNNLHQELEVLTSLEVRKNRVRKIDRIIDVYNDIEL